jgi:hypothetical protein
VPETLDLVDYAKENLNMTVKEAGNIEEALNDMIE